MYKRRKLTKVKIIILDTASIPFKKVNLNLRGSFLKPVTAFKVVHTLKDDFSKYMQCVTNGRTVL